MDKSAKRKKTESKSLNSNKDLKIEFAGSNFG
jgi:hypothetical protein